MQYSTLRIVGICIDIEIQKEKDTLLHPNASHGLINRMAKSSALIICSVNRSSFSFLATLH